MTKTDGVSEQGCLEEVRSLHEVCRRDTRMRTLVQRLKRLWNTPVEFYGVDRPEPQAGPWHGLMLFVVLLVILGLLWLIRYLPERTYLVQLPSMSSQGRTAAEGWPTQPYTPPKCWRGLPSPRHNFRTYVASSAALRPRVSMQRHGAMQNFLV
jgi:hypothetical protein